MPFLSAFTPLGLLTCSSTPSHAEKFYRAQVDLLGGQYRLEEGDHMEATIYARAICLGVTKRLLQHAGDQVVPVKAAECLPYREEEYGSFPTTYDSLAERRARLALYRLLPKQSTTVNVTTALRAILGDAFVGIRPTPYVEAVVEPANCGDQPMNLQRAESDRKNIRILDNVSILGSQTVQYDSLNPEDPRETGTVFPRTQLIVGDVLVVDPTQNLQIERVTVTAVGTYGSIARTFTGVFTKAHDANVPATTMPFPYWRSTKRHSLIILTDAGALDAETRRKANEWCARLLRGVSTWSLAGETAAGVTGPWRVDEGIIGVTTIGEITL